MDDDRFWWQELTSDNIADLLPNISATLLSPRPLDKTIPLFGIVSNEDGGIIAYAIGLEHAEEIVGALKFKQMALDAAWDAEGKFGHEDY